MMELTQEERDDLRRQAENARIRATTRFGKVMRRANRAAAKAGVRAAARSRSKGKSNEEIEQARDNAAHENWELEWIRDYIRIDPELVTRVFYGIREEKYVDEAVERVGRAAASKLGIDPSDWWDCAYGDDEDLEEDADPSEVGEGHAHAGPDLH
jgi:hypothetical protein